MHAEGGFPPMLFDLKNDPDELVDLGRNPEYEEAVNSCYDKLFEWSRRVSQRTTVSDQQLKDRRGKTRRRGIVLGVTDEDAVDAELIAGYKGRAGKSFI